MKPVFVDASALIAIGNKQDVFHRQAIEIKEQCKRSRRQFVTTSAVLLELGNAFSLPAMRPAAISLIEAARTSEKWNCVNLDNLLLTKGLDLYKKMTDKDWGLVDCTSIVIAREMGITEIFTTDHHFEQAGFLILLKGQKQ